MTASVGPRPNGGWPLAAKASVAAQPHQSVAAVTGGALDQLGGEVARRAHHQAGHGEPDVVGDVGDAEVDDHRVAVERSARWPA